MQADVQPGRTAAEIADLHGLTTRAVQHAISRGQVIRASDEATIERECLRCKKLFVALGQFIRICDPCKQKAAGADEYLLGWIG